MASVEQHIYITCEPQEINRIYHHTGEGTRESHPSWSHAAGRKLESGQLMSRHYIAEISLNMTKPQQTNKTLVSGLIVV